MKTIKTYITTDNTSRLSLELKVKGKYRRVEFSNGGLSMNGAATLQTSDEDIQKALESSKYFGSMFKLKSTRNIQEPAKTVGPKDNGTNNSGDKNPKDDEDGETMTFANFNELRDYLVSEHNCKSSEVKTLADALETAKKLGLKVTIE